MQENPLPHQKTVFVCCNRREPGERVCCASQGGQELRDTLKAMVKERGYRAQIRVNQSGCMDKCEDGLNVMILPDNVWLSNVTEADLEPLLDRLIADVEEKPSE